MKANFLIYATITVVRAKAALPHSSVSHENSKGEWSTKREEARHERERLKNEIISTTQAGRPDATLLTAGQTAGGIKDIPTVAEIMRRLIAETETALTKAADVLEAA